jgi:hypothetical protein
MDVPNHAFIVHENIYGNDVFEGAIFDKQQHVQSWG